MNVYMKRNRQHHRRRGHGLLACVLFILILLLMGGAAEMRKVTTSVQLFTESNRELKNPNRGLYSLYPFAITD